jgi:hypothetical protein
MACSRENFTFTYRSYSLNQHFAFNAYIGYRFRLKRAIIRPYRNYKDCAIDKSKYTFGKNSVYKSYVPWIKQLVADLSPRKLGLDSWSVHVIFVADKVALGQVFLQVLRFSPLSIIPPMFHTRFHSYTTDVI